MEKKEQAEKTARFTRVQTFQIMKWIETWKDTIVNAKWTASKLAAEVSQKVGYMVPENTVRHICQDLEISFPRSNSETRSNPVVRIKELEVRCEGLENTLATYERRIASLESTVESLLAELDIKRLDKAVSSAVRPR